MPPPQVPQNRYHRQMLLRPIGAAGQERLAAARVLLVGCGALGTVIAEQLVRAGVGFLRLVDRDIVELSNLQRQVLFDEEDVCQNLPKAIAATRRLRRINSSVSLDPHVSDVHPGTIEDLALDCQLILDGTDNVETRYLINDLAVKHRIPWVYGACIGTEGRVLPVRPEQGPCLRCLFPQPPAPGELPTCDTAGVLAAAAGVVASLQVTAALKLLLPEGEPQPLPMLVFDLWSARFRTLDTADARRPDCPCCGRRQFEFLAAATADRAVTLCGRNAVQIAAPPGQRLDLSALAARLQGVGQVEPTAYFLRCRLPQPQPLILTIFPDGRLLIQGTQDPVQARSIAAKYIGI